MSLLGHFGSRVVSTSKFSFVCNGCRLSTTRNSRTRVSPGSTATAVKSSCSRLRKLKSIKLRGNFRLRLSIIAKIIMLGASSFITQVFATIVMGIRNNLLKAYGAKNYDRVKKTLKTVIFYSLTVSAVVVTLFQTIPDGLSCFSAVGGTTFTLNLQRLPFGFTRCS